MNKKIINKVDENKVVKIKEKINTIKNFKEKISEKWAEKQKKSE